MSLYNMIGGGSSPMVPMLYRIVDKYGKFYPGRPRDAWLEKDVIVILTRTGGGNRDDYEAENASMVAHPLYVGDEDDDFDSTYAKWRFKWPEDLASQLEVIYRHLYDKTEQGVRATTNRALAALRKPGDTVPAPSLPKPDEAGMAELRAAADALYDKVMS